MSVEYWRCQNNECSFFMARRKKYPYNQKGKRWEDKARWLIAKGEVSDPNWVHLRCPHCDYNITPGLIVPVTLDSKPISVLESFKQLKKKNADS